MSIGQAQTIQLQLEQVPVSGNQTVFSPPGVSVETAKYPIVNAGILASSAPSEFLSIFDHPEAWMGLDREAILTMRGHLYRFVVPVDAREMQPHHVVDLLQKIALSVSPVALGVEVPTLPPRHFQVRGGQLPSGPEIPLKAFEILSEPEISRVAQKISEKDIAASDAIWQLFDYDYSLEQIVRLMAVGLLGRIDSRRLVPMRGAYKAVIDSYVSKSINHLGEKPYSPIYSIHVGSLYGDTFTAFVQPGEPAVDYVSIQVSNEGTKSGTSFEDAKIPASDPRTSVQADHARFSAYNHMLQDEQSSHITIFHFSQNQRNRILGPWVARAGVKDCLTSSPVQLESKENALAVLKSILRPNLKTWSNNNLLVTRLENVLKSRATSQALVQSQPF
ncbi:MAG: hypothetical protein ACXADL_01240 [Candidatus Thorarchaeota archaeon]|jgi:hypothetical protein